jgi:hypothetical protein
MPNIRRPCRRGLCRTSDRRQRSRHGSWADTAGLDRPRAELSTVGRHGPRLSGRRGVSVGVAGPYGRCTTAVLLACGAADVWSRPRGRDGVEVVEGGEGVVAGSRWHGLQVAARVARSPSPGRRCRRPRQQRAARARTSSIRSSFFPCRGRWFRSRSWCAGRSPRCHPGSGAAARCQCRPGEPGCRPGTGAAWRCSNG